MFQRTKTNTKPTRVFICGPVPEITRNLFELEDLLKEKYHNIKVNVDFENDQVKVTLLNGRNGMNEGIDEENKRPIEFLKSFEANITKKEAEYPYWSYSVVTFGESKLKQVIEGLKVLPTPTPEDSHGKLMAMC